MAGSTTVMLAGDFKVSKETLEYWAKFNLDRYYNAIAAFTFETIFIPLDISLAQLFLKWNRKPDSLTNEEKAAFQQLKDQLNKSIEHFTSQGKTVFLRLSTRSPKDAVDKVDGVSELLAEEYKKEKISKQQNDIAFTSDGKLDATLWMTLIRRTFLKVLSLKDADQAFTLLSRSERSIGDFVRGVEHCTKDGGNWDIGIILREFVKLREDGEFRGFVHHRKLTAISQYDKTCFYPELKKNKDQIQQNICAFYEKFEKSVPQHMESFIIDFAVIDNGDIKVVELNPWGDFTGSALFSWKTDRKVLEEGPLEFRIIEAPMSKSDAYLSPWKHLIEKALVIAGDKKGESPSSTQSPSQEKNADGCRLM